MWREVNVDSVRTALGERVVEVAGGPTTARAVSGARIVATHLDLETVEAGELVVTSADAWSVPEASAELPHILARVPMAALAVRMEPEGGLPAALVRAAEAAAVPVLGLPPPTSLAEVRALVLEALLAAQSDRLGRFLEIHSDYTEVLLAGGGVPEIAAALHRQLGCTVVVLDSGERIVVTVPSDAPDATTLASRSDVANQPVQAGDRNEGRIVVARGSTDLDDDEVVALERAAQAVAMRNAQTAVVAAAQDRFASVTLEELISGAGGDVAALTERAASFGWDLQRPRAVLLASIDGPVERRVVEPVLASIAACARATLGADAIVWARTSAIAALIPVDRPEPSDRRALAEELRRELDARVRSASISIGVGRAVSDPADLPRSYTEAARAVDVGRWARGEHVVEVFDELGLDRLLAATRREELDDFVDHAIGPLLAHDREHGSDLAETLAVWLETRNMAEAARRLFVHYNTMKNRLERVEAVLGPVLTDAARSLECEVALHIVRHHGLSDGRTPS